MRSEHGRFVSDPPDPLDREAWARANPAYGYRISDESLEGLYNELGPELFARECLCVWEPALDDAGSVFPAGKWEAVQSPTAAPDVGVVLGVDVNPERSHASIVAADADGVVELVERREGTGWVAGRVSELQSRWSSLVAVDSTGPGRSLVPDLDAAGVSLEKVTDMPGACASFFDRVCEGRMSVRRSSELSAAVAGAAQRFSGDTWRWDRRTTQVDISPLVAATVALWVAVHGGTDLSSQVW
jgi:hypothetical protein